MKEELQKKILKTTFTIILSVVILLAGIYFMPSIIFLFPLALVVLGIECGLKYNIISLVLSLIITTLATDIMSGIVLSLLFIPITIILNTMLIRHRKPMEILAFTTIVFFISILLTFSILNTYTNSNLIDQVKEGFQLGLEKEVENIKKEDPRLSESQILKVEMLMDSTLDYFQVLIPTIFLIFSFGLSFINYGLASYILNKKKDVFIRLPMFAKFELPNNIFMGMAVMFIPMFIIKKLGLDYGESAIINLVAIFSFLFYIQGLAVIDFRLILRKLTRGRRVLNILLIVALLPISWFIVLLGILDSLVGLRRI